MLRKHLIIGLEIRVHIYIINYNDVWYLFSTTCGSVDEGPRFSIEVEISIYMMITSLYTAFVNEKNRTF